MMYFLDRFRQLYQDAKIVGSAEAKNWKAIEDGAIVFVLAGISGLIVGLYSNQLFLFPVIIGCLSGVTVVLHHFFSFAGKETVARNCIGIIVILAFLEVAILIDKPLWVIFSNGFSPFILVFGCMGIITKHGD